MTTARSTDTVPAEPPADDSPDDQRLSEAIGNQFRSFRQQLRMTITDVSRQAGISPGMLLSRFRKRYCVPGFPRWYGSSGTVGTMASRKAG